MLQRQHNLEDSLQSNVFTSLPTDSHLPRKADAAEHPVAAYELKENQPSKFSRPTRHKKDVVQYSRRPVPSLKQKEQAAQQQYLTEIKEYFAEVHVFTYCELVNSCQSCRRSMYITLVLALL